MVWTLDVEDLEEVEAALVDVTTVLAVQINAFISTPMYPQICREISCVTKGRQHSKNTFDSQDLLSVSSFPHALATQHSLLGTRLQKA